MYSAEQVDTLVTLFLGNAERPQLDPILDACAAVYESELDEAAQVEFKGKAKTFVRSYGFLSAILPYSQPAWEKLSIFLSRLLPKLKRPAKATSRKACSTASTWTATASKKGPPWRSP